MREVQSASIDPGNQWPHVQLVRSLGVNGLAQEGLRRVCPEGEVPGLAAQGGHGAGEETAPRVGLGWGGGRMKTRLF